MSEPTKSGIVADGRSLMAGDRKYMPGETFTAPASEVLRLRQAGYLVDPSVRLVEHPNVPGGGLMLVYR
jgi:hypothetical protein